MQVSRGSQIDHGNEIIDIAKAKAAPDNGFDDVVFCLKLAG